MGTVSECDDHTSIQKLSTHTARKKNIGHRVRGFEIQAFFSPLGTHTTISVRVSAGLGRDPLRYVPTLLIVKQWFWMYRDD